MTTPVLHECAWNEFACSQDTRYSRRFQLWLCGEHLALVEAAEPHVPQPRRDTGSALVAFVLAAALLIGFGLLSAIAFHHMHDAVCTSWAQAGQPLNDCPTTTANTQEP